MLSRAFGVGMDEHPLEGRWSSGALLLWEKLNKILGLHGKWDSVRRSHKAPSPQKPDRCLGFHISDLFTGDERCSWLLFL